MICELKKWYERGNLCDAYGHECGRPTRANLFFLEHPNAPCNDKGIPLVKPCTIELLSCNSLEPEQRPDYFDGDDSYICQRCQGKYWLTKICNMD